MRKTRPTARGRGIKIAAIFLGFIAILISLSLVVKLYILFAKSRFDGAHQFILLARSASVDEVIAFNPDTKSISVANLKTSTGIPLDATVSIVNPSKDPFGLTQQLISGLGNDTSLTIVDRIRLFFFAHSLDSSRVNTESAKNINLLIQSFPSFFIDHTLYQENIAVSVVNATGMAGVGERIAKTLGVIGVNVVSVSTADNITQSTNITYVGESTYTLSRLSHLLGINPTHIASGNPLADITVTIGKSNELWLK